MNQRMQPSSPSCFSTRPATASGFYSRVERPSPTSGIDLPLKNELLELCSEIAGALLRGYADGKSGAAVRGVISKGLVKRMGCPEFQAQSLVDLSLELIHLQAYGKFRRDELELSLLIARGGGEVADPSDN